MCNTARPPRDNRTITVDFRSKATSFQLLGDGGSDVHVMLANRFLGFSGVLLTHKRVPIQWRSTASHDHSRCMSTMQVSQV